MDCKNCLGCSYNDKSDELCTIPFADHEAEMDRAERNIKRWMTASGVLCGVIVLLIGALILTNI